MDGEAEPGGRPDKGGRADTATRIGRYRILERIGQGATAAVYRATDEQSGRDVALKLLLTDLEGEEQVRTRFLREVEIARVLRHRNLVTVYDAGEVDGRFFLAMELLGGVTLREYLTLQPALALEDKLDLMMQLCEGLAVAHDHGIYHRDLKPSNLFVREDGGLKILDFGIARLASSSMTVAGLLMGTPDFMSPEQARGADIDQRSDIFSAGAVFYYVLSGRKPFPGAQLPNVLHKVEHEEPAPLTEADASPMLVRIVAKALAKAPAARYPQVRALLRDLIACRRELAGAARTLAIRAREQSEQARTAGERCRTLGRVLGLGASDLPSDDLLSFTGLASRHPDLADRGPAMIGWAPMRRAMAADVAEALSRVTDERRDLAERLSGAAETLEAAERASAAADYARAIELGDRVLAVCPSSAAQQVIERARYSLSAQDAAVRQRRATEAMAQAKRAMAHGDWASAEGHLVRARELDPQTPDVTLVHEDLRSRRVAAEEARLEHERQHHAEIAALLTNARDALARGDVAEAARAASAALEREPGQPEADRIRAEAVAAQRTAAERADRAKRVAGHVERGQSLLKAKRFEEARTEGQHALALDPAHQAAHTIFAAAAQGVVEARRSRDASAIATRSAVAARAFLAHAQRALLLGDLEQARGLAETALAIDAASEAARAVLDRARQAIEQLGDQGPPVGGADPEATLVLAMSSAWTRLGTPLAAFAPRRPAPPAEAGPAAPPAGEHRLRIVRVAGPSRDVTLTARRHRVGRALENEIVLDDPSHIVSRVHAEVQPGRGAWVLVDCDSDHGVWVDGERVARVTLEPGVPVVIGPYRLSLDVAVVSGPISSGVRRPSGAAR
jgi:tRNA A-37 threonylcarbamoyl transferase component Bud32/tetratricopeptide (TPR) repeat protein